MLPFIIHGMKKEADRGSFLWEFSTRGPQKILSKGFNCSEDHVWDPLIIIFPILVTSVPMIEGKKALKMNYVSPYCME